jgi:hypothetical protein
LTMPVPLFVVAFLEFLAGHLGIDRDVFKLRSQPIVQAIP